MFLDQQDDCISCSQTPVMFNMYSTSRNPQHFADPLSFKPERWSRDESTELNPFSSLPFGFGPRSCYGEFGETFTWLALIWQTHKWMYEVEWGGEGVAVVLLVDLNQVMHGSILVHHAGRRLAELEIHVLLIQVRVHWVWLWSINAWPCS